MGLPAGHGLSVTFTDHGNSAIVELDLRKKFSSTDLRVDTTADTLTVTCNSDKSPLFKPSQLYGTVQASATSWLLQEDGTLQVTLKKLPPYEPWPALEAGAQEAAQSSAKPSPGDALEARKSVKALLEAAQNGDVEMLKVHGLPYDPKSPHAIMCMSQSLWPAFFYKSSCFVPCSSCMLLMCK